MKRTEVWYVFHTMSFSVGCGNLHVVDKPYGKFDWVVDSARNPCLSVCSVVLFANLMLFKRFDRDTRNTTVFPLLMTSATVGKAHVVRIPGVFRGHHHVSAILKLVGRGCSSIKKDRGPGRCKRNERVHVVECHSHRLVAVWVVV